ncbi:MAG: response regulator [Syntrophothermus sp.]
MEKVSLFIVEDEALIAGDLKQSLSAMGYNILGVESTGEGAVTVIDKLASQNKQPDIILMDVGLAGKMDGIEAARQITRKYNSGIIFLTALEKNEVFKKSFPVKPYAYLFKPIDLDQVKVSIEVANYQRNLELANARMIIDLKNEMEQRKLAEQEKDAQMQEKLRNESRMNQLLRQKHQMEMDLINRELATSSIFISQKNKIIGLMRKDINRLMRKGKIVTKAEINRVLKSIDENVKFENDWYRIKAHFEKIYPEFFDRLREKYPQLTPNDHKLCALLRMNLNTKEISQILKITGPSTEISRIRLRKKLDLPKNVNLVQYICSV